MRVRVQVCAYVYVTKSVHECVHICVGCAVELTVIVKENEIGKPSSNPVRGCLCFTSCECHQERHVAIYSTPSYE